MAKKKVAKKSSRSVKAVAPVLLDHDEMLKEHDARAIELLRQRRLAENVLQRHKDRFLGRPEVTGLHVGLRKKEDKFLSPLQYCIRVHVGKKLDLADPRLQYPLETEIEGIRVDVLERIYDTGIAVRPQDRFVDPLSGGIPIGRAGGDPNDFGTLGGRMFLRDNEVYLTNKHVVKALHTSILQPPSGNTPAGQDAVIGDVIDFDDSDGIDAAIIKATGNRVIGGGILTPNDQLLTAPLLPGFVSQADNNRTKCIKIGAVTGDPQNLGTIQSVDATVIVNGRPMDNQIVIVGKNIMQRGDSGSLILVPGQAHGREVLFVVGLAHAVAQDGAIVACHFHKVANRFGIKLF